MKMETGYELDSVSELPPIPAEFAPMEDPGDYSSFVSSINPLDQALAPLPHSDFSPSTYAFSDLDLLHLQPGNVVADSSLSLLNRHLAESTHLDELVQGGGVAFPDATAMSSFLHMPNLHSVDQTPLPQFSISPGNNTVHAEKRRRFAADVRPPRTHVERGFTISPSSASGSPASASSSTPQAKKVRDRRRRIAEKTRSLEKLMPWEKKMDMATLLEEAHKYIKFLQAQVAVLRWMPLDSVFYGGGIIAGGGSGGGGGGDAYLLRVLNRQQILQVMANSSGVQTSLYARGCCVFSREQLLSLKMMAQSARNL